MSQSQKTFLVKFDIILCDHRFDDFFFKLLLLLCVTIDQMIIASQQLSEKVVRIEDVSAWKWNWVGKSKTSINRVTNTICSFSFTPTDFVVDSFFFTLYFALSNVNAQRTN